MQNINRIKIFITVAKHESFNKAANEIGMTGPAVSKQVQKLEDELGTTLLHRTTRKVTLSEEGAIYYSRARQAIEDLVEAEKQIQDLKATPKGILKVSIPMSFGILYLAKPIAEFAKQYPEVQLDVDFSDTLVNLADSGYDIAVRIGKLKDSSLIARKLSPCPIYICASPSYLKTHGTPKNLNELKNHKALLFTQQSSMHMWNIESKNGNNINVDVTPTLKSSNGSLILEACLQGVGIAYLPAFFVQDQIERGLLTPILKNEISQNFGAIYAVFPKNRHLSSRVKLFVKMLSDHLKEKKL